MDLIKEYLSNDCSKILEDSLEEYVYNNAEKFSYDYLTNVLYGELDGFDIAYVKGVKQLKNKLVFKAVAFCDIEAVGIGNEEEISEKINIWLNVDCYIICNENEEKFCVEAININKRINDKRFQIMKSENIPWIKKDEIDSIAEEFLTEFYPKALEEPMPIPIDVIAETRLNLKMEYMKLSKDGDVLGATIFCSGMLKVYNSDNESYELRYVPKGTIILDPEQNNIRRERFTIAHEVVHWWRHRCYFVIKRQIACRCNDVTINEYYSPNGWLEWQAENLAAAILMPKKMFCIKAREYINAVKYKHESCTGNVIVMIADFFKVSKQAAQIRLIQYGFIDFRAA